MTGHYGLDSLPEPMRGRLRVFGGMLRAEREKRGLSTRAVAALVGLSAATVSRVESGVLLPDLCSFLALVAWVGVPLAWFDAQAGEGMDAWQAGWDACAGRVRGSLDLGDGAS